MRKNLFYVPLLLVLMFALTACGEKKLESISLVTTSKTMTIGETKQITVTFNPSEVIEDVTWTSSDEEIATVENGLVTAKANGYVTIMATTSSGIKDQTNIDIYNKAESISLDKKEIELYVGDTYQLKATVAPEDATYKDPSWTSSNSDVATVENGLVTAKEVGTTTIEASLDRDNLSEKCNVVVKEKPIVFSGSGSKTIKNVNIPSGMYKATLSYSGKHNFIVHFYEDSKDEYGDLLANEIGNYSGAVVLKDGSDDEIIGGMLEVKSSGKWTIKFERVTGTIEGNKVSGKGDVVTGWFNGTGERMVAKFKNSGKHNFIVKVYDEYGDYDLLVNEIGSYNGEATFITNSYSKYFYEVISSGSWSIEWE